MSVPLSNSPSFKFDVRILYEITFITCAKTNFRPVLAHHLIPALILDMKLLVSHS